MKTAGLSKRLIGLVRRIIAPGGSLTMIDPQREGDGEEQAGGCDQHQRIRAGGREGDRCELGAGDGAERGPEADERKEPLAPLGAVQIVGERPELRDHHEVENADPEEERDADVHAGDAGEIEQQEVRGKEQRHTADQPEPVHGGCERAVRRHDREQQERLAGGRVTLHLRAALAQDQRLAHDLQHRVEREQAEDVCGEQQRAGALAGSYVGDERQAAIEPRLLEWRCCFARCRHPPAS